MTSIRPNVSGREQSIRRNTPSVHEASFTNQSPLSAMLSMTHSLNFAVQCCTEPSARYKQCERPLWGPKQGH